MINDEKRESPAADSEFSTERIHLFPFLPPVSANANLRVNFKSDCLKQLLLGFQSVTWTNVISLFMGLAQIVTVTRW